MSLTFSFLVITYASPYVFHFHILVDLVSGATKTNGHGNIVNHEAIQLQCGL